MEQGFEFNTSELEGLLKKGDEEQSALSLFAQLGAPVVFKATPEVTILHADELSAERVFNLPPDVGRISCTGLGLSLLPSLSRFHQHLQRIDLSMNRLHTLDASFGLLHNLEIVNLTANELSEFPHCLLELHKLQSLNISSNPHIRGIPRGISQLVSLEMLFASDCGLVSIPSSIGCLTRLSQLHLHKNNFARLPSSICQMDRLEALYLQNNRIRSLPADFGNLTSLKMLFLQENALQSLPFSMQNLKKLWYLNISANRLQTLPLSMRRMSISSFLCSDNRCGETLQHAKFSLPHVIVTPSTLAADMLQMLTDSDHDDTDVLLNDGTHVAKAHVALLNVRLPRLDPSFPVFETPGPVFDSETKRWRLIACASVSFTVVHAVLEFLCSGAIEVFDRCPEAQQRVRPPKMDVQAFAEEDISYANELAYERNLMADMMTLLQEGESRNSDLKISVHGRIFHLHKFVMARCIPFRVMFASAFAEAYLDVVELPHEESDTSFECVVQFIYTGQCQGLTGENVEGVLEAATRWQCPRLVELCEELIFSGLDEEIVVDVLHLCQIYNMPQLKTAATAFLSKLSSEKVREADAMIDVETMFAVSEAKADADAVAKEDVPLLAHVLIDQDVEVCLKPLGDDVDESVELLPAFWNFFNSVRSEDTFPAGSLEELVSSLVRENDMTALLDGLYDAARIAGFAGLPSLWARSNFDVSHLRRFLAILIPALVSTRRVGDVVFGEEKRAESEAEGQRHPLAPQLVHILNLRNCALLEEQEDKQLQDIGLSNAQRVALYDLLTEKLRPAIIPFEWLMKRSVKRIQQCIDALFMPSSRLMKRYRASRIGFFELSPLPHRSIIYLVEGANREGQYFNRVRLQIQNWSIVPYQSDPFLAAAFDTLSASSASPGANGSYKSRKACEKPHDRIVELVEWSYVPKSRVKSVDVQDVPEQSAPIAGEAFVFQPPEDLSSTNGFEPPLAFESFTPTSVFSFANMFSFEEKQPPSPFGPPSKKDQKRSPSGRYRK